MKRYPVTLHVTRDEAQRLTGLLELVVSHTGATGMFLDGLGDFLQDAKMAFADAADAAEDSGEEP